MSTRLITYPTPQEYLAGERRAEVKSEYFNGGVFALPGESRKHDLIAGNVVEELSRHRQWRSCSMNALDMRVKSPTGLYTYPDVVAVINCEEKFEDANNRTLLNPTLLAEVLSESTADYDRGRKFGHYRGIESLSEYMLVSQDECKVERYSKQTEWRWVQTVVQSLEAEIELPSIQCTLRLPGIYHRVF